jgi:hypothetical protein
MDAGDRLACPAMRDDAGETLGPIVECGKLPSAPRPNGRHGIGNSFYA